jgi:hypothetical protein
LCSVCGKDLQYLLAPEEVASHFHQRARELAAAGKTSAALAQVERGLGYLQSAELHLMAAILAEQVGRYDQMRRHVAAIAVDDTLRPEAEWLLRAHQARHRAPRDRRQATPSAPAPRPYVDELLRRSDAAAAPVRSSRPAVSGPVLATATLLSLILAVYFWYNRPLQPLEERAIQAEELQVTPVSEAGALPAAEGVESVDSGEHVDGVESPPLRLPTPTPIPDDLTQQSADAVAESNPRRVVIIAATPFDLKGFVREQGYPELADLAVEARLQETTLSLQGIVHLDRDRRRLIEVARSAPGVTEVNAVDLLLLPLPVYIVREGDTLWSIAYDIFGDDAARIEELFALNRDLLPSADALRPGMELQVPPVR